MLQDRFVPPNGAFTRSVSVRFSHCDPAGIVYFPHYFDIFNGLIEDWYGQELGYEYAELIMGSKYGFPFVHIECDFKVPSGTSIALAASLCDRPSAKHRVSAALSAGASFAKARSRSTRARIAFSPLGNVSCQSSS